jgi:hypothetical protein
MIISKSGFVSAFSVYQINLKTYIYLINKIFSILFCFVQTVLVFLDLHTMCGCRGSVIHSVILLKACCCLVKRSKKFLESFVNLKPSFLSFIYIYIYIYIMRNAERSPGIQTFAGHSAIRHALPVHLQKYIRDSTKRRYVNYRIA